MSLCYDNCSKNLCDKDCIPNKIILGCKNVSIPGTLKPPQAGDPISQTLGSISIDLKCLKTPCVEIDVNAIVEYDDNISVTFSGITLTFRVFKSCDNEPEKEIKSFQYVMAPFNIILNKTESFNFTVCDCDPCPRCCCTYRVVVEPTSDFPFFFGFAVARIVGGTITVLGFSECND